MNVDQLHIDRASQELSKGNIVVVPTESFYALAVDATCSQALNHLSQRKNRPEGKPFPLLIVPEMITSYVTKLHDHARKLMEIYWPGPLTLVLPTTFTHPAVKGERGAAFRYGTHPVTNRLLQTFGKPITCTSANLSGMEPHDTIEKLAQSFDLMGIEVLDVGKLPGGKVSTIVDCCEKDKWMVVREGAIETKLIERSLS
ncbi:MAG: L-threonylcarbamoyladenylate synthase [Bdellovibrionota bacterium]